MSKSTTLDHIIVILFGLVLLALAVGMATDRIEIHLSPPTHVAETENGLQLETDETEEKLSARTPEELFWFGLMEEWGYKYVSLPIRWDPSDWAEEIGLSEMGLFYRIRPGYEATWYMIYFEHNPLEQVILIDDGSDDHTDRILVREPVVTNWWGAFEKELALARFARETKNSEQGYLSLYDFERAPGNEKLFDAADEIISHLKWLE